MIHCETEPGTALFFHSNLLHTSGANLSDEPRWALICCYNTKHNDPYKEHHHPRYSPLEKVADSMIREVGAQTTATSQQFLLQDKDDTTRRIETVASDEP